jgi:hypothetical protein
VNTVEARIVASAAYPITCSTLGGPSLTEFTVGLIVRSFIGATVEEVSTPGWRRKFDPSADDEEALRSDAFRHDSH